MYLTFPDAVHQVPLRSPEQAADELVELMAAQRDHLADGAEIELRQLAVETVDSALEQGAVLLAMVTPAGADPALLTGIALDMPVSWDLDRYDLLGYALENGGDGPPVRNTMDLETPLGPALIALRVPSRDQARAEEYRTVQLQGVLVDQDSERMLLLTLASPSIRGWDVHQRLFAGMIASAGGSSDPAPAPRPEPTESEDDYFNPTTFQV